MMGRRDSSWKFSLMGSLFEFRVFESDDPWSGVPEITIRQTSHSAVILQSSQMSCW